ncbi:MAG: N-formylglutamate amidohydrolase, partial [Sphingomonadaceae bacterium]
MVDDARGIAMKQDVKHYPPGEAYSIAGTPRFGGILVVADHASNHVPADIELGIDPALMDEHIALDIGVGPIATIMSRQEGAASFSGAISRLVCDFNRAPDDRAVIPETSDGIVIPGNSDIDRGARLARFHEPYHEMLDTVLATCPPMLTLVLHSYTPALTTQPEARRPWHC